MVDNPKFRSITLRYYEPLLVMLLRVLDALFGSVLFFLVAFYHKTMPPHVRNVAFILFCLILLVMHHIGIYRSWRFSSARNELSKITFGCIAVYFFLLFILYFFSISHWFSRTVLLNWMIFWPILLSFERIAIRLILRKLRQKGLNIKTAVIIGVNDIGYNLAKLIRANSWSGSQLLGFFDDDIKNKKGFSVLGRIDKIVPFISDNHVDMVYIALPIKEQFKINDVLRLLRDSTVSVSLVPDFFFIDVMIGGYLTYFDNLPIIALQESPFIGYNRLIKRFFDLLLSLTTLILLFPFLLTIAIAIRITSPGPIIFKQWRYGLNGQPIQIYKFRTMTVCEDGYCFRQAIKNDPRITRLGAFLRKNSLDELPQLLNVLKGSMSLIGPRPHPAAMNEQYRKLLPGYMLRHKVKPGMTGLAQINGCRGETDTLEKVKKRLKYDLTYIRTWSLWNDINILVKTILKGAWRTNAY
jgi:putative colanic acid biosynthesis UDP-glucose lipid carrier transferase